MNKAAGVIMFLLAYPLLLFGCVYLWESVFWDTYLVGATGDLFIVVLPVVIMFSVFLFHRYRTRDRWISQEAEKWLAMRLRQKAMPTAPWRRIFQRGLLWVPSVLVLVLFLFLPETAGIAAHLLRSRVVTLGNYRIRTPLTYISGTDQSTHLWMLAAPGIGRIGIQPYYRNRVPVTEMVFLRIQHPEQQLDRNVPLESATVLAKKSFPLGKQTLTCWDLIHKNKFVVSSPTDRSVADIGCSTESDDFYAHFFGWRHDSATFYKTLQQITVAE